MKAALRAARRGLGRVSPNPLVGAALVLPDGSVVAGGHLRFGGPHAEARLLDLMGERSARTRSSSPRLPSGTTLYVTLEPCCHQGKTPPCLDRILEARPVRVVVATLDPDPRVSGRGVEGLRRAGIPVELGPGEGEALSQNLAFHLGHVLGRSLFRLKLAGTIDARLAPERGSSRWITGPEARRAGHRERAQADAVLVGSGTVLMDDPEMTVRYLQGPQPSRIVLDSSLRIPPRCRLWRAWREETNDPEEILAPGGARLVRRTGNYLERQAPEGVRFLRRPRLILATRAGWSERRLAPYRRLGWEVWELPVRGEDQIRLLALARRTAREGLLHVLVEAGPLLAGALLEAGLVDELSLYQAPLVLGGGKCWPAGFAAAGLARGTRFALLSEERLGADLRLLYRREGLLGKARFRCSPA